MIPGCQTSLNRKSDTSAVQFVLTRSRIRQVWWTILAVEISNAVQLLGFSYIYLAYSFYPDSLLQTLATDFLSERHTTFLDGYSVWIGVAYAAVGGAFVLSSITTLRRDNIRVAAPHQRSLRMNQPSSLVMDRFLLWCWALFVRSKLARDRTLKLFVIRIGRDARLIKRWAIAYGVQGRRFEHALVVRETLELAVQVFQAYNVSQSLSRPYVNYAFTSLIAVNTLVHPLVDRLYQKDEQMKRFTDLFADFFLDYTWECLLPVWMYWPYLRLDQHTAPGDVHVKRGIGSVENAQQEVVQILVVSTTAFVVSIFPFFCTLVNLHGLRRIVLNARRVVTTTRASVTQRHHTPRGGVFAPALGPSALTLAVAVSHSQRRSRRLYALLSFIGVSSLTISLLSSGWLNGRSTDRMRVLDEDCYFPLTPWFATTKACAAWVLDCNNMNISGHEPELEGAFNVIHRSSIVFLAFKNCPRLEIPVAFRQFRQLRCFQVINSKLTHWSPGSSISAKRYPLLQSVLWDHLRFSMDTKVDQFGMQWPSSIEDVTIMHTDITRILLHNPMIWCVNCSLSTFPSAFFEYTALRSLHLHQTHSPLSRRIHRPRCGLISRHYH